MAAARGALWLLAVGGGSMGTYVLVQGTCRATTVRELAEFAMIAIACAVVPYCLARAVAQFIKKD